MAAGSVSCPSVHFCVLGHESMVPFLGAGSQLEGGGITLGYFTRATCSLCALLCVLPVPCQLASLHCHSFLALSTTAAPRVSPPLVLPPHSQGPGMGLPSGLPFRQLLPPLCCPSAFLLPPPVELAGGDAIFSSANSLCCFSSLFLLFLWPHSMALTASDE